MTEYEIDWDYTSHHRYDSDIDDKVEEVVKPIIEGFGGKLTGSWGGTGFDPDPDAMCADSGFSFEAADLDQAEQVRRAADTILKFYDERYEARLKLPMSEEDFQNILDIQLEEAHEALQSPDLEPETRAFIEADIVRINKLLAGADTEALED